MNYKDKQSIGSRPTTVGHTSSTGNEWSAGVGMVYLAMSPWNGMWKNRHQLMSRFGRCMPVLYVEPPVRLRQLRRDRRLRARFWADRSRPLVRRIADNLYVLEQSAFHPVSHLRALRSITLRRWHRRVQRAVKVIDIRYPVLWLSQPSQLGAVGRFSERLSIYHVVDEYGGYTGLYGSLADRQKADEIRLLNAVDMTIVVSPELLAAKSGEGRDVHLVENAVDFDAFRGANTDAGDTPELDSISTPILCYTGLIGKRLDFDLIIELARSRPDYAIVLVGDIDRRECESGLDKLSNLPNVHFLGRKDPHELPGILSKAAVGLLPYARNLETTHISPLKMYEYMAAGIPVVSTPIPAALRHRDIVSVADDSIAFAELCDRAVRNEFQEQVSKGIEVASSNTWDHRVRKIAALIERRLLGEDCAIQRSESAADGEAAV